MRKDGNIKNKFHSSKRATDWWMTEKPQGWNPTENGFKVSLNHDSGQEDKPKSAAQPQSTRRTLEMKDKQPFFGNASKMGTGKAAPTAKDEPAAKDEPTAKGGQLPPRQSSLGQGAAGFWEYEARQKAGEGIDKDPEPDKWRGDDQPSPSAERVSPGKHDKDYDWWVSRKMESEKYDSSQDVFFPTEEARVTSKFGEREFVGPSGKTISGNHQATDYGQNPRGVGKNVYASVDGEIVNVSKLKDGNNYVELKDQQGNVHGFYHTSTKLRKGTKVEAGDPFGNTDLSGRTTGPHLHYSITKDGKRIDPDKYLSGKGARKIK